MTDIEIHTPAVALDPGTPEGVSWFEATLRQAEYLAGSQIVPQQFRGKPADIVVAAMYGRDMGWSPTMAMSHIHVINGKPALSAQSMVALVRGVGHSITGEKTAEQATAVGTRTNGDTMTETFTMDDARAANLDGSTTWKQYPSAMLWARAVSALCRSLFPDVLMGLSYTPEELEGIPDARPVDTRTDDGLQRDRMLTALKDLIGQLEPGPDTVSWETWKTAGGEWWKTIDSIRAATQYVTGLLAAAGAEPFEVVPRSGDAVAGETRGTDQEPNDKGDLSSVDESATATNLTNSGGDDTESSDQSGVGVVRDTETGLPSVDVDETGGGSGSVDGPAPNPVTEARERAKR